MNEKDKTGHLSNICIICMVLIPIANIYRMGNVSVGDMIVAFLTSVLFLGRRLQKRKSLYMSKAAYYYLFYLMFFLIVAILMSGVCEIDNTNDFLQKWFKLIVFGSVLLLISQFQINYKKAMKWYINIAVLVAILEIIQVVLQKTGRIIYPYLANIPLNYNLNYSQLIEMQRRYFGAGIYRASSIFPEPSHLAHYELLALVLTSGFEKSKYIGLVRILISGSIIASGSANGIAVALILWIIWYFSSIQRWLTRKRFILMLFLITIVLHFVLKMDLLNQVFIRLSTADGITKGSTGNLRLLQGIAIFEELPLINKIFGIGFGNVQGFLINHNIVTAYLNDIGNDYMNAFSTVLVSTGVVGFSFFLIVWIRLYLEQTSKVNKEIWLVLSLLFTTSSIFLFFCDYYLFIVFEVQ